eukprot:TRINITY_DN8634_c0_g2_i1.p1 TRINITY_DN8634_c0_g2~~TRINITY_DN8634_c0_g2_i1.p1  ORF type:complete len:215 (-),score=50.94 TRINITY_DN8634_c0_g2_i1:231-821(-)
MRKPRLTALSRGAVFVAAVACASAAVVERRQNASSAAATDAGASRSAASSAVTVAVGRHNASASLAANATAAAALAPARAAGALLRSEDARTAAAGRDKSGALLAKSELTRASRTKVNSTGPDDDVRTCPDNKVVQCTSIMPIQQHHCSQFYMYDEGVFFICAAQQTYSISMGFNVWTGRCERVLSAEKCLENLSP